MTEQELTQEVETLKGRLVKAAEAYKAVVSERDALKVEIENIKAESANPQSTVDEALLQSLQQKVKDYEDELAINGDAGEEIKKLNARLEKAKVVFAEQKERIANLTEDKEAVERANQLLSDGLQEKEEEYDNACNENERLKTVIDSMHKDEIEYAVNANATIAKLTSERDALKVEIENIKAEMGAEYCKLNKEFEKLTNKLSQITEIING